jgi:ABC-type multidrug transport system fused ATPase/permease subunit
LVGGKLATVQLAGIDVRRLTFSSLRGAVGAVTQDGHLFHDTIRANLRYGAPAATDSELVDALHRARLGDLLAALPDDLDTVVGEHGYRLSGGERQPR